MKLQLSYVWRAVSMSEQSSMKQKERSCTGLQHGPCKWGVRIQPSAHGSAARTVQEKKWFSKGLGMDRVCWLASHGSSARGVSVRHAIYIFRTRGSTWTVLFVWLARVSEGFSTGHVELIFSTGRANWHGSFSVLHGSSFFCTGRAIFSSFEVGNLIFSQYSGFIMI